MCAEKNIRLRSSAQQTICGREEKNLYRRTLKTAGVEKKDLEGRGRDGSILVSDIVCMYVYIYVHYYIYIYTTVRPRDSVGFNLKLFRRDKNYSPPPRAVRTSRTHTFPGEFRHVFYAASS